MKQNLLIFIDFSRKLLKNRNMLKTMALRELKAAYVGSVFGLFWAVLYPLFQLAIYGIVFGVLFGARPGPGYGTESFFLFLFCGLVPWQFFSQTVKTAANVVVANRSLVKRATGFSPEILPVVTVISSGISHLIGMGLVIIAQIVFAGKISPLTPLFLVYMFFVSVLCVGFGWIVSSLNVYLRDVLQVINLVFMAWFYLTPIIYPPSIIPEKALIIFQLNPLYHVIDGYRYIILAGKLPPVGGLLYLSVASFISLAAGGLFFRKLKPGFAEVL